MDAKTQLQEVSKYYGETLKSSDDLRTSACCPIDSVPPAHQAILAKLHPQILTRFYGCGSPIPSHLSSCTVLDLGCGTGRDAYLASALVGSKGRVIGVDMTDAQLDIAREHIQFHTHALLGPQAQPNVDFRKGFIEDLTSADISDNSVDVVISNCVCNLSPDKRAVFDGVYRALRSGGEFYFSDVYASRRLSSEARKHPVLVSECLGGALYVEDFRRIMAQVGFTDVRVVSAAPIVLHDSRLRALVEGVEFYSLTVRAFKLAELEDRREDFGHIATYLPNMDDNQTKFRFDIDNVFELNVPRPVDANTAAILKASRFASQFMLSPAGAHRGIFRLSRSARPTGDVLDTFRAYATVNSTSSVAASTKAAENGQGGCCGPPAKKTLQVNGNHADSAPPSKAVRSAPADGCCGPRSSCC